MQRVTVSEQAHPVRELFVDTFQRSPSSEDETLLALGVSSLELIRFLCRIESELRLPMESLMAPRRGPLTLRGLMDEFDSLPAE